MWVLIEAASLYKWMKMHNHAGFSYGLNIIILILNICILLLLFSPYVVSDSATPWTAAHQASLSFTISLRYVCWVSDAIQPSQHLYGMLKIL